MFDKKKWESLQEAVRQDDAEQVTNILKDLKVRGKKEYLGTCHLAIEHNAAKALRVLLGKGGFEFHGDSWESQEDAKALVEKALSSAESLPLLSALYDTKTPGYAFPGAACFLTKDTPSQLIRTILDKDPSLFQHCLSGVGLYSIEKLSLILSFTARASLPQRALDNALVQVAEKGDIEKAKLLLDRKADPDYYGGLALLRAAAAEKQEMVGFLLPLMSHTLCRDLLIQQKEKDAPAALIAALEAAVQGTAQKEPAAARSAPREAGDGYAPVDADTLSLKQTLPDGSTLTTLFNFATEQQTIVSTTKELSEPGIKVIYFEDIKESVRNAMRAKLDELNKKPEPPSPRTYLTFGR